ncbi:MAG: GTPase Era [Alphaproteobacteria bacterium]
MDEATRFGFVAVLGAPNAGKSTLVNQVVGAKVSIVSPKVQTTRTRVLGIAIADRSQLVFVDTPGIFAPRKRLERAMVDAAWRGAKDADAVLLLVDAARGFDADTRRIVEGLRGDGRRATLVLNKVDAVRRPVLLGLAAELSAEGIFDDVFMISALNGDGVADLVAHLAARMPEGPWHFPEDQLSDMPMRLLAAEVTREKLFLQTHDEVPYSVMVETEAWEQFRDGSVRIDQTVYVQRDSQKGIVLGKGGQRIRAVGETARRELEAMLGCKVHLFLHVKHREKWTDDPVVYRLWGLEFDA